MASVETGTCARSAVATHAIPFMPPWQCGDTGPIHRQNPYGSIPMPKFPLQKLPARSVEALEDSWIATLEARLADPATDRALLTRETLLELAYPEFVGRYEAAVADEALPVGTRLALAALDSRNVTLEPEYYGDCDQSRFQPVKPLLWLILSAK